MMIKMLIIIFILLEILSFAKSGQEEILHDGYTDKFDNLPSDNINAHESLSLLQFQPSILDFLQRSIGDPHDERVYLFNKHKHKKVYLGSISGSSSSDFYSSYFEDKVIGPESNTSFKIVFLPRQVGETNSSLIIHTSFGTINYQVKGVGIECQYRLRPLIGIKLPINSSISPEISLYNPHAFPLQISEIYSSGGEFQLELPTNTTNGDQEGDYKLWEIPSFTSKPIIRIRFNAFRTGNHSAYVRIKIASSPLMNEEKMLVVPIEIEVYNKSGLYMQSPLLDFGMIGNNDGMHKFVYNLLNSGQHTISIKRWGMESDNQIVKNSDCIRIDVVQFRQRNFTDYITVDVDWLKCPDLSHILTGHVYLVADGLDDDVEDVIYRFPFYGHIIQGNLNYNVENLKFSRNDKKTYEIIRPFVIKNNYNVPLAITNISVPESCSRYFKLSGFNPTILQPNTFLTLLDIQPIQQQISQNITTIEEHFRIITNVSDYDIPLWLYSGLLRRIVPVDFARERSQIDEKALNFGALLPVGKQTELLIAFVNENPISIEITHWKGAITSGSGQAQLSTINRGCSKMSLDNLMFCSPRVPPGEWIVFSISVQSNAVGTFGGNFLVRTPFEEINTPVKFSTAMGRLELKNKMTFEECFPGKICSLDVQAYSTFMKKMYVEGIAVDMDGISYEFAVKQPNELPIIMPNVDTNVGKLFFNPKEVLCKKRSTCYTSFDMLSRPYGEMWMRLLKNFTASIKWDNEKLRAQLNSFMEIKQNIKQMQFRLTTSQIRRYEFNASIDFIWPRLIQSNIEFPYLQVNKLETQFIDIFNPSDQILFVHFVLHNISMHGEKIQLLPEALIDCTSCVLSRDNPFSLNITRGKDIYIEEIAPRSSLKLGINFFAQSPGTYSTLLYLRNNLTIVEARWLTAHVVVPQFKFGNRKPGNSTPLQFEINEKHVKLCEKKTSANVLVSSKRTFTAKNFGEVPLSIYGMRIENDLCVGYGFKVLNCEPFQLQPNESKKIEIGFSPDFTLSRVVRTLNFDTSIGSNVNFTLIGTVATPALDICGKNIQRPTWESDFKSKVMIVLCVALILVIISSIIDSDRILKEHAKSMTRERGSVKAPLDLRRIGIGMVAGSITFSFGPTSKSQEQLNNLNNHNASLNTIRKRLTITKNLTDLRNKFMTATKNVQNAENSKQQSSRSSAKADVSKNSKTNNDQQQPNSHGKDNKKVILPSSEDDSTSSSSKDNCDAIKQQNLQKNEIQDTTSTKNKNVGNSKKSKNQLNISDSSKDQKNNLQQKVATVKPLNNNNNQNRSQNGIKENKNSKIVAGIGIQQNTKSPSCQKNQSPTMNVCSGEILKELNQQVNHQNENHVFVDGSDSMNSIKVFQNDMPKQPNAKYPNNKNVMRDKKMPMNPVQLQNNNITNNNSTNGKRSCGKDNKQFTFKQNFTNIGKLPNNNSNMMNNSNMTPHNYFATNWTQPVSGNSIWSNSSYSEVVAQPTLEQKPNFNFPPALNGNMGYRHHEMDFSRSNYFNRSNDSCILEQEDNNCTQYGPIGTRKSPSSTPSWEWEPLNTGLNQHLTKPLVYNNSNYYNSQQQQQQQQNYGIQQSKLMNLMSYNDKIQQQQQQQQQQIMDERYQYIMRMKERKQSEWLNSTGNSSVPPSLWSSSTNWASPSPPLGVPPGFEQQFHHQQQGMQSTQPIQQMNGNISNNVTTSANNNNNNNTNNNNQQSTIPAYDLFKSLSVIWEPNRNDGNDRETRNQ